MTTSAQAERAITTSTLVVGGVYVYRKLIEPAGIGTNITGGKEVSNFIGLGPVPPVGVFITAWGFTFLTLSIVAQFAPGLGMAFAILIAVSTLLGNGLAISAHINDKVKGDSK